MHGKEGEGGTAPAVVCVRRQGGDGVDDVLVQ